MSLESKVFNSKTSELVIGTAGSISEIADKCLESNLIAQETYEKVQLDKTPKDKARLVLSNIGSRIRNNAAHFHNFVDILEKISSCEELGSVLKHELKNSKCKDQPDYHAIQETQPTGHNSQTIVPATTWLPPDHIDSSIEDLKKVIERLNFATFDNKEKESKLRSLETELEDIKTENIKIKEEKENYCHKISKLTEQLERKDQKLDQLESRLSAAQKERYEDTKEQRQSQRHIETITTMNAELAIRIEQVKSEKEDIQRELNRVQEQYNIIADVRAEELGLLEARYGEIHEELQNAIEELNTERRSSKHLQNFKRRISRVHIITKVVFIFIVVIVIVFAVTLVAFSICLEDSDNYNIEKCSQSVVNIIAEYMSKKLFME